MKKGYNREQAAIQAEAYTTHTVAFQSLFVAYLIIPEPNLAPPHPPTFLVTPLLSSN
jgi:hypothetical protein